MRIPINVQELTCPECGALMVLKMGKYSRFYGCSGWPRCQVTHGMHADGEPLGIPANKATRDARIRAHDAFDLLWKSRNIKNRHTAYTWLRRQLKISKNACHIGKFDERMCDEVIRVVTKRLRHLTPQQLARV